MDSNRFINLSARSLWDDFWRSPMVTQGQRHQEIDPYYSLLRRLYHPADSTMTRILEVGCGSGFLARSLISDDSNNIASATLVDYSMAAIHLARSNNGGEKRLFFVVANALQLPFRDNEFDLVFNEGLNEHFEGPPRQSIFNEMSRTCKIEGSVIVIVPNSFSILYRLETYLLRRMDLWLYGFEKSFSVRELQLRMIKAGIGVKQFGGAKIIRQAIALFRMLFISGRHSRRPDATPATIPSPTTAKKTMRIMEQLCERNFWFLARDIGIAGVKKP